MGKVRKVKDRLTLHEGLEKSLLDGDIYTHGSKDFYMTSEDTYIILDTQGLHGDVIKESTSLKDVLAEFNAIITKAGGE